MDKVIGGVGSRKALIVKMGAIGDVVMAIPAVWALHQQGYQIDWVCGEAIAPLLACYPWIRIIPVNDRLLMQGGRFSKARVLASLWSKLLPQSYDLCATLYYDVRYRMVTLPVRASRKVMLSHRDRTRQLLPGRHHTDEYARILLGWNDTYRPVGLSPIHPDALPANPLGERKKSIRIALVPGGASNMLRSQILRRWPAEKYAELAKKIIHRGWEVVLVGGPDDGWVREYFSGIAVVDRIGGLRLPEVVSAFDACDAVISHDTGPMHLAGISHAGLVGLFGPTDPGSFLPRREGSVGIWGGGGLACRPCYDGREFAPCMNNGCMQEIDVKTVLLKLDSLLSMRSNQTLMVSISATAGAKE
ncbi:glycosyltransferase family 9 protein [soil metagenome]